MHKDELEKIKYPIGKPNFSNKINEPIIKEWIEVIEVFPSKLDKLTKDFTQQQLDTKYRKDGWTVRQVIHHCADSHHNSYTRFKWALTESNPVIKTYFEDKWATLFDSKSAPIHLSINHLKALHEKWVYLLKGLSIQDLNKTFIHPDGNELITLNENIGIYAWHCKHHYAHIEQLAIKKGWK